MPDDLERQNGTADPYERCPVYESDSFRLRLVSMDDAEALLECYKNATVSTEGNAINCTFGYGSKTLCEMKETIGRWLEAYVYRGFIRFAVVDKKAGRAVGTIEIFGSDPDDWSALRIDLEAAYETEANLSELIRVSDSFFTDVGCGTIAVRGMPGAEARVAALLAKGYEPFEKNDWLSWEHCYVKRSK